LALPWRNCRPSKGREAKYGSFPWRMGGCSPGSRSAVEQNLETIDDQLILIAIPGPLPVPFGALRCTFGEQEKKKK